MMRSTIFLCLFFSSCLLQGQTGSLFPIYQSGKFGYINQQGEVVIQPVYYSGHYFSEGLASVRQNGRYGFINASGKMVIKPEYDFATDFVHGLAVVFKDGKPLFINQKGKMALPAVYSSLRFIDNKIGIITTPTKKEGVIDVTTRELLIDTLYSSIQQAAAGVYLVTEYKAPGENGRWRKKGLVNADGEFIVPFGQYSDIHPFTDGYAVVEIEDPNNKDGDMDGVIDTHGKLLFQKSFQNNSYLAGEFHDGYAIFSLYKYWIPEKPGVYSTSEKSYTGYINLQGDIVLNDTNYRFADDFSNGRAFVKDQNFNYLLIDRHFKRVGDRHYRDVVNNQFRDHYAIVSTDEGYGIIDTTGQFVVPPQYDDIDPAGIVNGYFFFLVDDEHRLYGMANLEGDTIIPPVLNSFDRNGFVNGLLQAVIDGKSCYVNTKGKIVWQEREDTLAALLPLNIDYMNRGYFYAYSTPKKTAEDESGGWATSTNLPQPITAGRFPEQSLTVFIDTAKTDSIQDLYKGYKLYISNTTADTVHFNAQDSRLYLQLQAQDSKGEWRDIEYLPSSWCGNSYHTVDLEPNAYWHFTIPQYEGEMTTQIRAALQYIDPANPKLNKVVYSNVINGTVNPGQFWNKMSYTPKGLMDPYND